MDMTNIAYEKEYQARRKGWEGVFASENLDGTEHLELGDGYVAIRQNYCGKIGGFHITPSETRVFDASGAEAYRYRNMDNDGEFIKLIHHSNDCLYLLFRIDLYGYGVYDVIGRQEFFYVPKESETFIWTDVHYNRMTNVLAISGCYWACPNGVFLMDFQKPMCEAKWIDVIERLDGGYDKYDGLKFTRWDGCNLTLSAYELTETNGKISTKIVDVRIAKAQYSGWLK